MLLLLLKCVCKCYVFFFRNSIGAIITSVGCICIFTCANFYNMFTSFNLVSRWLSSFHSCGRSFNVINNFLFRCIWISSKRYSNVRVCVEKIVLYSLKLARCDCFKCIHKIIISMLVILFDRANPVSSVNFHLLSFLLRISFFPSSSIFFINDYELMALFTFPLLLEFSAVVTQNTTHVFAMRSKPHTRICICLSVYVCGFLAGFISFLSMPKCQYLIRW